MSAAPVLAAPVSGTAQPLLSVDRLRVEVPTASGWAPAVVDVSFDVARGETVGVVGESGSGKTLMSLALMGMSRATGARLAGGTVRFDGVDLAAAGDRAWRRLRGPGMGMIFQQPMRSLNPAYTVGDQITESVRRHLGLGRRAAMARAVEMLELVQIPRAAERVHDYPHSFSGGMCQRVMIAMVMAAEPRLLIADEPTTALDVTVQAKILRLIGDIQEQTGIAVLLISHDLGVIAETCHRAVVMYAGESVESGRVDDVFLGPRHPYTSALLGAVPSPGAVRRPGDRLLAIPGSIPRVGEAAPGCRFAPRCAHVLAQCTAPAVIENHAVADHAVRCVRHDSLSLQGVSIA